ncbi:predicted protein [Aspergillus nidulans FGSC A4]|uniref:Uncharacterized protein n=1 Tax=Emericella nidulans (strain FGSC A4 / ATCC 38163 / CBS 112.46 / NRRL 194 / M139) TaxID=227321 RepID=Q5BA84_EMENI|nr:hypothetical protein [Aspergillus nidulans FGSC A4]EAA64651.1 predicted protein [Aspergillus nidulans FGSC A4]CBF87071.1 TPA: hypothetical protein ANIA_02546 [Aspergillus nidulans FGSC A4]|eukprot:XP_660150.1 predicted protein [Aspergillus nidulans FGSC A4]
MFAPLKWNTLQMLVVQLVSCQSMPATALACCINSYLIPRVKEKFLPSLQIPAQYMYICAFAKEIGYKVRSGEALAALLAGLVLVTAEGVGEGRLLLDSDGEERSVGVDTPDGGCDESWNGLQSVVKLWAHGKAVEAAGNTGAPKVSAGGTQPGGSNWLSGICGI